ncbi:hypothetical protein GGR51DRAFT_505505 [Nemania sp. FL0031]|nr:hypothetical protein GGR51DRAFT_505505 [Nemania sp. FL0031]
MMGCEAPTPDNQLQATTDPEALERARLRRNQRNSRARKQAYIHDLESRWNECVKLGARATAEMQSEARRVQEENGLLRTILHAQGFDDAAIQNALASAKKSATHQGKTAQISAPPPPTAYSAASWPCLTSEALMCAPEFGVTTTVESNLAKPPGLHNWFNDLSDIKDAFGVAHDLINDQSLPDSLEYVDPSLDSSMPSTKHTRNLFLLPYGTTSSPLQTHLVGYPYTTTNPEGPQMNMTYTSCTNP